MIDKKKSRTPLFCVPNCTFRLTSLFRFEPSHFPVEYWGVWKLACLCVCFSIHFGELEGWVGWVNHPVSYPVSGLGGGVVLGWMGGVGGLGGLVLGWVGWVVCVGFVGGLEFTCVCVSIPLMLVSFIEGSTTTCLSCLQRDRPRLCRCIDYKRWIPPSIALLTRDRIDWAIYDPGSQIMTLSTQRTLLGR